MEEKISSDLKLADLRIDSFRRSLNQLTDFASSVSLLNIQWNALEEHLKELHSIRDSAQEKLEDVKKREEELYVLRQSTQERIREVEAREVEFELIQEKEIQELKSEFEFIQKSRIELQAERELIEKKSRLLREKEERLEELNDSVNEKARQVSEIEEQVNQALKEIENKEKQCTNFSNELKLKEEQLEKLSKTVALKDGKSNRCLLELEAKEKEFERKRDYLGFKEKLIGDRCKKLELEKKNFLGRCEEVELKEKLIDERCEELELEKKKFIKRCEKVELKEKLIDERCEELEVEKKKFMDRCKEVELDEKLIEERREELELEKKKFIKRCEMVELKERLIDERCEELEVEKKKLMERHEEVEMDEKLIEERCEELELEKNKIMVRCGEIDLKEKLIEERCEELELEKKKFMEQCGEVELKERLIKERCEELELEKKTLMERCGEIESKEKLIEERSEQLELEKRKFMEQYGEVELKEKSIKERCVKLELEKKKFMEQCEGVELKQKRVQRWREFESKEKKLFIDHQKSFPVKYTKDYPGDANLHFTVTMDGKALQIFLNEHCEEYDSMRNDVLTALSFSSDPAKLVLDAIQGFYPPHLKKGDKEFEKDVIRRSCILLLEQLLKVSTDINPPVKQEAMKLAFIWITKMKADAEHSLEVLGFLQLLATYRLASAFDADELLTYLEIVAQHSQALELFHVLGLADKVSGFIENLTRKKQQVEAIRFIHAFKLVNEFPPEPLLVDFLRDSKNAAKKLRKRDTSLQGQVEAANKRIVDLKRAIRCIEECKIEYKPSVKNLKQLVEQLEKENFKRNANLRRKAKASGYKIRRRPKRKRLASTVEPTDYPVLAPVTASSNSQFPSDFPKTTSTFVSDTDNQVQQLSGNKRPRIGELVEKSSDSCHGDADQGNLPLKSKDVSAALDLQPERDCLSFNTNKDALRHALNTSENYEFAFEECFQSTCDLPVKSKDASAALDLQPERNCLSFNTNKESLRRTLNTSENYPFAPEERLQSTCDPVNFCFLMEQLKSDSFQINPEIKEQAKGVALHWQTLLEENRDDPLEVIWFLRFVAAYKLASIFSADKLLGLLDTDYWCKKAPDLCQVLGLTDKIPIFVENLIRRGQNLEAVKYIYALNIVDVFPPLPILKNHLISSSTMQGGDTDKEIKALKDVIKCISDFKITGLSPENLKKRIVILEKQNEEKLEEQKEEKPLVVQTSEVKTNCVSSRSRLDQQVSTASAPITSESALNSQLQQQQQQESENKCKVSIGATSTVHSTEHPLQHSPNFVMNKDVSHMNAPPNYSSRQPLPQNLPSAFISQDNVPSMNLPSRHDSSVQNTLQHLPLDYSIQPPQQHLPGLHTSQCDPGMNAPPRYVTPMQPHWQNPPSLCMSQANPCMNEQPRQCSSMQAPLQHPPSLSMNQGKPCMNAPPQHLPNSFRTQHNPCVNAPPQHDSPMQSSLQHPPGLFRSQGDPGMNPSPSQYSSMQPPLQHQPSVFTSQVGPSMNYPPAYDNSAQPSLQNQPYASQGHPYMNAPPRPYSSGQPVLQYQQGSHMSQAPFAPWNYNFPANPPNMELQWNGFAYVPVP